MPGEPFPSGPEADKAKEQAAKRRKQITLDYKVLFNSERGQRVLKDLQQRFGFRRASANYGTPTNDVFLNEGMKQPLYHIENELNTDFRKTEGKPKRAISRP